MSANGLDVFDKTLQTTNIWLDELMEEIGPDRQLAWHVMGVVLRHIRDRIPIELAVNLGSQLPLLLRGTFYDQWKSPGSIELTRTQDGFLESIKRDFGDIRPVNVGEATKAVFRIISRHADAGQVEKVRQALPESVRVIWHTDMAGGASQVLGN